MTAEIEQLLKELYNRLYGCLELHCCTTEDASFLANRSLKLVQQVASNKVVDENTKRR